MEKVCVRTCMKLWWWWKKILGIVGPPRCSDAFAVVTRVLVVPRHHPFGGCEGHKTCARAQQRIERLGGPIQMLVNEYQYFGCWGGAAGADSQRYEQVR